MRLAWILRESAFHVQLSRWNDFTWILRCRIFDEFLNVYSLAKCFGPLRFMQVRIRNPWPGKMLKFPYEIHTRHNVHLIVRKPKWGLNEFLISIKSVLLVFDTWYHLLILVYGALFLCVMTLLKFCAFSLFMTFIQTGHLNIKYINEWKIISTHSLVFYDTHKPMCFCLFVSGFLWVFFFLIGWSLQIFHCSSSNFYC